MTDQWHSSKPEEKHCLEEIVKECESRKIRAQPVVAIENHPDLKPLTKKIRIPFHLANGGNKEEREQKIITL